MATTELLLSEKLKKRSEISISNTSIRSKEFEEMLLMTLAIGNNAGERNLERKIEISIKNE